MKVNFEKRRNILLILAMIFCFFTMYYADITVTSRYGFIFLDSIFDGKILSFYENALQSGVAPEGAVYDIGMYIVFGIWSIPLWILDKIFVIDPMSVGCLLWYKALVVGFTFACAYEVYKIVNRITKDEMNASLGALIFLSSLAVFFPTFVVAQYDIIGLFFMLLGMEACLDDRLWRFIVFFAIAMIMKPFPILAFVLLVVIREKNILKIFGQVCMGALPFVADKVLYSLTYGYKESAGAFVEKNTQALFSSNIIINGENTSLFFLFLVVLYGVAFFIKKDKESQEYDYYVSIMLLAFWSVFFIFVGTAPYWIVYLEPFILVIALSGRNRNYKLLFDFAANISIIISSIFKYSWVFGGDKTYSYLILKGFTKAFSDKNQGITIAGILRKLSLENYMPVYTAIFAACLILILLLGYKDIEYYKRGDGNSEDKEIIVWHVDLRIAILYMWIVATVGTLILSVVYRG